MDFGFRGFLLWDPESCGSFFYPATYMPVVLYFGHACSCSQRENGQGCLATDNTGHISPPRRAGRPPNTTLRIPLGTAVLSFSTTPPHPPPLPPAPTPIAIITLHPLSKITMCFKISNFRPRTREASPAEGPSLAGEDGDGCCYGGQATPQSKHLEQRYLHQWR